VTALGWKKRQVMDKQELERKMTPKEKLVLASIEQLGGSATVKELLEIIKNTNRAALSSYLSRLSKANLLVSVGSVETGNFRNRAMVWGVNKKVVERLQAEQEEEKVRPLKVVKSKTDTMPISNLHWLIAGKGGK
jgi:DNA-binding MarR family transcriptional regulator